MSALVQGVSAPARPREWPIIADGEALNGIRDGRITAAVRAVEAFLPVYNFSQPGHRSVRWHPDPNKGWGRARCGDLLWVKERWFKRGGFYVYGAEAKQASGQNAARYMPKEACRQWLRLTCAPECLTLAEVERDTELLAALGITDLRASWDAQYAARNGRNPHVSDQNPSTWVLRFRREVVQP